MNRIVFLLLAVFFSFQLPVYGQEGSDEYYHGKIIKILDSNDTDYIQSSEMIQKVRVRIENGLEKDREVTAENHVSTNKKEGIALQEGDNVVVVKTFTLDGFRYYVVEFYRLSSLAFIAILFVCVVIFFGRMKGVRSFVGLLFSIYVIAQFIVPQIYHGRDPFLVSVAGSFVIIIVSMYLAHGLNKRTSIAVFSTALTLAMSAALSVAFVTFSKLFGTGTEESLYLQIGLQEVNLQGLLLGGIIIGTLGILDDITAAQAAAVEEIKKANPALSYKELYERGLSVGKEHIASLVNTLALAYAGVSLPLFLLFLINQGQPLWVIMNGESIAEEIIRTLIGSTALILAVPLTTGIASYFFAKKKSA